MKYLIFNLDGMPDVKLFREDIGHDVTAYAFQHAMQKSRRLCDLVSAGFCNVTATRFQGVNVKTFGHSESLDLHPRPEDAEIIKTFLETESVLTPEAA